MTHFYENMKLHSLNMHRWENNIKIYFEEIHIYIEYVCLFQSRVLSSYCMSDDEQCKICREFLDVHTDITFVRMILLHWVY